MHFFWVFLGVLRDSSGAKQTVEIEHLGENGYRRKSLDKSLLAISIQLQELIKEFTGNIFFSYLAIKTTILSHTQTEGHLNN